MKVGGGRPSTQQMVASIEWRCTSCWPLIDKQQPIVFFGLSKLRPPVGKSLTFYLDATGGKTVCHRQNLPLTTSKMLLQKTEQCSNLTKTNFWRGIFKSKHFVTRVHHGDEWLAMLEYLNRRVPGRWMGQMRQVVRVCPAECTVDHCRCQRPRRRRSIILVAPFCCRAENQQGLWGVLGCRCCQDRTGGDLAVKSDWTLDEHPFCSPLVNLLLFLPLNHDWVSDARLRLLNTITYADGSPFFKFVFRTNAAPSGNFFVGLRTKHCKL